MTKHVIYPVQAAPAQAPTPHCRAHLEFRSDCEQCVSEREFS